MEVSNITIAVAFAAGLASFLSPCVLPLVPGYISLMSGVSVEHLKGEGGSRLAARRAVIINSLAFNAGISIIFILLGLAAGWAGNFLFSSPWARIVGGLVIIAFGLQLIGLLKIGALYKDTRKFSDDKPTGPLGSLMLGVAFAAGWTPCIGPILGGILGLAATSGGWKSGLVLSLFYAAGLAIPFLAVGLMLNVFLSFYTRFRRHLHKVEVVSGIMLIVIGLMVASNNLTWIAGVLGRWIPNAENLVAVQGVGDASTQTQQQAGATGDGATTQQQAAATRRVPVDKASFKSAPDVELKTLDGQTMRLSDLRGRVVLLNFWATWCVPCRSEIPTFNAMQSELGGRGFTVVGVTTQDSAAQARGFQKDFKQDYTVVTGSADVATKFGVAALPVTFVIDREGRIRKQFTGEKPRAQFEAEVLPVLDEDASSTAGGE